MVAQEYSLGQSSNRSLALKYGVSEGAVRLRAKNEGWVKDLKQTFDKALKEAVINETAQELPRNRMTATQKTTQKTTQNAKCVVSDEQIVEAAVRTSVEVIKEHRVDIKKLHDLADKTEVVLVEILRTKDLEKSAFIFGTGRDTVMGMLQKYVAIKEKIINLSRQTYNLDNEEGWKGGTIININSPSEIEKLSDTELNQIIKDAQ